MTQILVGDKLKIHKLTVALVDAKNLVDRAEPAARFITECRQWWADREVWYTKINALKET